MDFTERTFTNDDASVEQLDAEFFNERESTQGALYKLTQTTTIANTVDGDYTANAEQNASGRIIFGGSALTAPANFIVDTTERGFYFQNDEAQAVTVKTSAGTGISVAVGAKKNLWCDGTNVITPADDAEGATTTANNVFTVGQRTTETAVAWSATPNLDMNKADFYIDCSTATGEMAFTATNIPAAGTNQAHFITFIPHGTHFNPTFSADFADSTVDISSTGTYSTFAYAILRGKIVLGNKREWS